MALTGRAALAAAAGALLILAFRAPVMLVVVNALLLAAITADVALAAPVRAIRLTRSGDNRVLLGERASVELGVENPSRRTLRAVVRDAWQPSAGAAPPHARITVRAGAQARLTTVLSPDRRGDKTAAAVTIRSLGPLGLAARQGRQAAPWTVRVLPPFRSRRHLPEKLSRLRQLDGQHRALLRGQGTEFDSLREYVVGDDVRSIDWRASARLRDVMVRTWRPERDRRVMLVLDTGRTAAGRVAGYPRLDAAMDAAQLLTALASKAGDRVDLIAADYRVRARVLAPSVATALAEITDALATLEPELTDTDWRLVVATVLAHARRRCLVVLLTDLNPSVALVPELRALSARHELLIGAVADPRLAELAAGRGDAASVYAAAAAEKALSERSSLTAQLTRLGATVADAPPGRIAPALADAYLSLKARGRL